MNSDDKDEPQARPRMTAGYLCVGCKPGSSSQSEEACTRKRVTYTHDHISTLVGPQLPGLRYLRVLVLMYLHDRGLQAVAHTPR